MRALHKVLVVDDDPVVGKSFNRVLSDKGYLVVTAQNAHEALKKIREEEYDVVFTDIKMPGMDGIELAERVKARRPWTPVVIVTGYGTTANEERARAAGVSDFLRKPLSPEMIEGSADHALHEPLPVPVIAARQEASPVDLIQVTPAEKQNNLKNIALLVAAPFIGLIYAVSLPLVGVAMLAWVGARALADIPAAGKVLRFLKNLALFIAAPFVGLAYAVALPFVGIGMLAWVGVRALMDRPSAE